MGFLRHGHIATGKAKLVQILWILNKSRALKIISSEVCNPSTQVAITGG
jgi:hypothetical protein